MSPETAQAGFEGWAILEIFGHQRYAGYVTTQNFGAAAMFRLDVPALEERERILKRPTYIGNQYAPAGSTVKEGAIQAYTKLFGVGAIYAITPCTQEAALEAVESLQERPLMQIQVPTPETKQLQTAAGSGPDSTPQTDWEEYEDDEEDKRE